MRPCARGAGAGSGSGRGACSATAASGVSLTYIVQPSPDGLAQAYLLAESFLAGAPSALVVGDNIFFGHSLPEMLVAADARTEGGTVFG